MTIGVLPETDEAAATGFVEGVVATTLMVGLGGDLAAVFLLADGAGFALLAMDRGFLVVVTIDVASRF